MIAQPFAAYLTTVLRTLAMAATLLAATEPDPAVGARPNVIVCMVDDMGFSDAGCFGGEIQTPNLDRLAAGGVRFVNFHNTSRCCPTSISASRQMQCDSTGWHCQTAKRQATSGGLRLCANE